MMKNKWVVNYDFLTACLRSLALWLIYLRTDRSMERDVIGAKSVIMANPICITKEISEREEREKREREKRERKEREKREREERERKKRERKEREREKRERKEREKREREKREREKREREKRERKKREREKREREKRERKEREKEDKEDKEDKEEKYPTNQSSNFFVINIRNRVGFRQLIISEYIGIQKIIMIIFHLAQSFH